MIRMLDSYFLFVLVAGFGFALLVLFLVMPIVIRFDFELLILVPILLAVVLMGVMVFYPDPFTPDCPACGASYFEESFCFSCGADLVDDCACGRVWKDEDVFCPDCGLIR